MGLRSAIAEISLLSDKTLALTERFLSNSSDSNDKDIKPLLEEIKKLRIQLTYSNKELEKFTNTIKQPYTDAQAYDFKIAFTKSLGDMPSSLIQSVYNYRYFLDNQYPEELNRIIANELANEFQSRNLPLPSIWQELIARNGVLV